MTTVAPGRFIVCKRLGHLNPYWATTNGRDWFSAGSLEVFMQDLAEQHPQRIFKLPTHGADKGLVNLTEDEQAKLSTWLGAGGR